MNPTLKAALWMSGAVASFSSMAVAGREVSDALDTFEIMTYRSLVGFLIIAVLLTATGKWGRIATHRLRGHFLRNLAHFTGQNLWFFAIASIPLANVFALEFTSPLWVIALSPLILGERLTPMRALAALAGFIGILIVTRPGAEPLNIGMAAAASAAIFFALTNLATKRLTRTEPVLCIMFWLTLIQLVLGLITAGMDGDIALPDARTAPWLVVIGCAGLLAHYCVTSALAIAPATVVMPFDFARLPTIGIVGMLLYGEPLEIWVLVGAVVIFGGNYLNIWAETRSLRRA